MAGSNSKRTLTAREWLEQQLLLSEEERAPEFWKLLENPKLKDDARQLAAGLSAQFALDERASPTLAREDPLDRALKYDQMFQKIAVQAMLDRTEQSTLYIRKLVRDNPDVKRAKALRKLADESIIDDMTPDAWAKKVSEARKLLPAK